MTNLTNVPLKIFAGDNCERTIDYRNRNLFYILIISRLACRNCVSRFCLLCYTRCVGENEAGRGKKGDARPIQASASQVGAREYESPGLNHEDEPMGWKRKEASFSSTQPLDPTYFNTLAFPPPPPPSAASCLNKIPVTTTIHSTNSISHGPHSIFFIFSYACISSYLSNAHIYIHLIQAFSHTLNKSTHSRTHYVFTAAANWTAIIHWKLSNENFHSNIVSRWKVVSW